MQKFICFLFIFCCLFNASYGEENKCGTLVVSYQTGLRGEKLDRIRFCLTGNKQTPRMYPKKGAFVDDVSKVIRMVIIDDLPPGSYTLEFVYPNVDGAFEETPPRQITIEAGKTVKIDQVIAVRYAKLEASYQFEKPLPFLKTVPCITIKDCEGNVTIKSQKGLLSEKHLIPGHYAVYFSPIPGFTTPAPISLTLSPNEEKKVKGIYKSGQ